MIKDLLQRCEYWESRSLKVLRKATIKQGIKASCSDVTNYSSVFTRDAVMAGIAGLIYDDQVLIDGLRATIEMLYQARGAEGQIASNYKIKDGQIDQISFGTLSPKIDSATWYLIGIGLLSKKGFKHDQSYVTETVRLLNALEYNGKGLIYVPQGGNWADEYPYEGYILYDQILRCWALQLLGNQYGNNDWEEKAKSIKEKIQTKYFNKGSDYFHCSFTPSGANFTFDLAAHALLGNLISPEKNENYKNSLDWINSTFLSKNNLPGAFFPVIDKNDPKWNLISNFHLFDFKNKPHHYHNGGVWLIWIGWYALTLKKHKKEKQLQRLGETTFDLLESVENFNFEEYFSADTKLPNGTPELCYTATGILFLCKSLRTDEYPIDLV